MDVIVIVDAKNGMLFNKRRQSRDKAVCEKMLEYAAGRKIWMNSYSAKLFSEEKIIVDEDFLQKDPDICFVENCDISPYVDKVETLILFHWNREYPADQYLMVDFTEWNLIHSEEFKGNSHEKITMEVYTHEKVD